MLKPSLNELPAADTSGGGGRKRAHANDENIDPSTQPPVAKQPRTIEIDLPNRYDDTLDTNHKEVKTKSRKDSKSGKKGRSGARSSQKSQKTEGQAQLSANGKGTSLNTSKDTSTTKVEESLTASNTESSTNSKDSSGKNSSAHSKDSTASGKDTSAHGKDTTANGKDSSNETCSLANNTDTTVQVEVMEERKTGQEVVSEDGESSRQVEHHDSGNASSAGESEMKAESVTAIGKELEPMCGDKDEPSTREEEIEVEVSNLVGEGVSAQSEEVENQSAATTPEAPPPLLHVDGDDL